MDSETPVDSDTPVDSEKLIGGPKKDVGVSTGKLVAVPSVKVPKVVDVIVLEGKILVHVITPSLSSLQEVVVTNFVLVTIGTESAGGVTVITT